MSSLSVSVIIPVKDGVATLTDCLDAVRAQAPESSQIIVVNDHSTDASAQIAEQWGATVVCTPEGRHGSSAARNVGAEKATGELLVFVDADVILQEGALKKLLQAIEQGADAAVGYYDKSANEISWLSGFKNTLIRAKHRRSGEQIRWFWTALGALRASHFNALGGFDEDHFSKASVEDMELGYRLSESGARIVQVFDARISHRHLFGVGTIVKNDFRKSRDWARMIMRNSVRQSQDHSSTGPGELLALASSLAIFAGLLLTPLHSLMIGVSLLAAIVLAFTVSDELALVRREQGVFRVLPYLLTRAMLHPIAAIGAALGTIQGAQETSQ